MCPGDKKFTFDKYLTLRRLVVKRFLDFLHIYHKNNLDARVHVLGASAGTAMHILSYTGVFQQFDSANWRVKANHYKIMFAYEDNAVAEAYIGNKKISYGSTYWKDEWDELLMRCECPICQGLSLAERKEALSMGKSEGFNNRAMHNAFHYFLELQMAKELAGTDRYERFIDNRVKGGFYGMFWKAIKKNRPTQQPTLDAFIKQDMNRTRKYTNLKEEEGKTR